MPGAVEDIHLFFDVTATSSNINGVDGSVSGTNSHFTEFVCSGAGGYSGSGGCSTTTLASFTIFSGHSQGVISITPFTSISVFKDVETLGPGALTSMGQTFEVSRASKTAVPEPGTLFMFGSAVVRLAGLVRRKLML